MTPDAIVILEDNEERIDRFVGALRSIGVSSDRSRVWRNARAMIRAIDDWLPRAAVISLDHDLEPPPNSTEDWGDGLEIASHLACMAPAAPLIIHSSNAERSVSMRELLERAGWVVRRVPPIGTDRIEINWLTTVKELLDARQ